MRLSVGFPGFGDLATSVQVVRAAEQAGCDGVWMAEHVGHHDAIVASTLFAQATSRLEIGVVGPSPWTRHPGVTAMELASLCEIAPGRVRAAVGVGQADLLEMLGQSVTKPVAATTGFTTALRKLLAGERVTGEYPGFSFADCAINPLGGGAPLDVMAVRPRMVRAACEVGDGLSLSIGASRAYLAEAVATVEEHLDSLGRKRDEFRIWASVLACVADDLDAARAGVLPVLSGAPVSLMETLGVGVLPPGVYGEAVAAGDAERVLTPEVVGGLALVATPQTLPGVLAEYAATGIDEVAVFLTNPPEQQPEVLKALVAALP